MEEFLEFMKSTTRSHALELRAKGAVEEFRECLKKARALRDEPLLEIDQKQIINELCDKLSRIEAWL